MIAAEADLHALLERLEYLGARRIRHSGRSLFDHLVGTFRLLDTWSCPRNVCIAGLFHSVYGTNVFVPGARIDAVRESLSQWIGADAERLVHLFSVSSRPRALLDAIDRREITDRFTGERIPVDDLSLRGLLVIECANLMEQGDGLRFLPQLMTRLSAGAVDLLSERVPCAVAEYLARRTQVDEAVGGTVSHA